MPLTLNVAAHYDHTVLERLECNLRILLFGKNPRELLACTLGSNYNAKVVECNFDEGQTLFSLFKSEAYGTKSARISDNRMIVVAQNHAAEIDLKRRFNIELLPSSPLKADSAAYTNIVHIVEPASKKSCIYQFNKNKSKMVLLRYDVLD